MKKTLKLGGHVPQVNFRETFRRGIVACQAGSSLRWCPKSTTTHAKTMENPITINPEAKKKIESSGAHTKAAIDATAAAAKQVGETVKHHAKTAYDASKEHLTAAAKDLGDAATTTAGDLKTHAQTALNEASTKAKNLQSEAEDYIRTQPLKALGIAFAIGLFFGIVVRR